MTVLARSVLIVQNVADPPPSTYLYYCVEMGMFIVHIYVMDALSARYMIIIPQA